MHLVIDLLYFANESFFKLLVQIDLYEDHNEIMMMQSMKIQLFFSAAFLPLILEKFIHQIDNQQILL